MNMGIQCEAKRRKGSRGFTLIELLAVMTIIVVLSGIGVGVARYASHRADLSRAESDMMRIAQALEQYRVQRGSYPNPADFQPSIPALSGNWYKLATDRRGSTAERQRIAEVGQEWQGDFEVLDEYDPTLPKSDPWGGGEGQTYDYRRNSRFSFQLRSVGPDSSPGTEDDVLWPR